MKSEKILDALGGIDDPLILECLPFLTTRPKRRHVGQTLAIAACLALLLLGAGRGWLYLNSLPDTEVPAPVHPADTEEPGQEEPEPPDLPMLTLGSQFIGSGQNIQDTHSYNGSSQLRLDGLCDLDALPETLPVYANPRPENEGGMYVGWEPDLEAMKTTLRETAKQLGIDGAVQEWETAVQMEDAGGTWVRVDFRGTITISLAETLPLPEDCGNESLEAAARTASWLLETYGEFFDMESPQTAVSGGSGLCVEQQTYELCVYDGAGTRAEQLLRQTFDCVRFRLDQSGVTYLTVRRQQLGEKLGDYPLLTAEEAEDLFRQGYGMSSVWDAPGEESRVTDMSVVYLNQGWFDCYLPYYQLLVEWDAALEGAQSYAVFYLPAVRPEYIEDNRFWKEPDAALTFAEKLWSAPDPDKVGDGAREAFLAFFEENPDLSETYEDYDLRLSRTQLEGREIAVLKCDGPLMASTGESQCFWYYYDDGTVTFGPSGVWSPETVDYADAVRRMLTERSSADTADYEAYVREAFTGYYMEHDTELRQLSQYDESLGNGRDESDYMVYYRLDDLQETSETGIYQASFSGMEFLWTDLHPGYDSPASENRNVLDQWRGGADMDVPEAIRMALAGSQSLQETGFTVSDSLTVTFRLQEGEHPFQYLSCIRESPQDAAEKMKGILMEETPFWDVGLAEEITIHELNRAVGSDEGIDVAISSFTVIDLDEDGIEEIVLWLAVNGNEDFGCEILHHMNEEVYGYFIPYRGFYSLKADGTFYYSSGAGNSGIGKIKFDSQAYVVEKITFSETQYDDMNQAEVSFVVNGHASSREDFETEMEKQDGKKDAEAYRFTDNHVEASIH